MTVSNRNFKAFGGKNLDTSKRLYEGMFLVDSALAAADWQATVGEIERFLSRADAEAVAIQKWDERRLAYDIEGKSRGTYILSYFNALPERIAGIERDVQLSEKVMRTLILRTDQMSESDIKKETPAQVIEREENASDQDGSDNSDAGGDDQDE
jgi:small subunit ribosomal protein S6